MVVQSMPDSSLQHGAIHGIVGQPWQIKAGKELKAIILPLTGGWVSGDPSTWPPIEALGSG
jgi:hypothetical protein